MIHCVLDRCVGCKMCEVTCSQAHFGAVSPALSRIRVAKLEEIGIDLAVSCLSCDQKPCLDCPTDALTVGELGSILLDQESCSGCGSCAALCPIGAIGFHDDAPLFCDLCGGSPACIDNCPTGALVDERATQVSLEPFMKSSGNPAQKRAGYTRALSAALRASWKEGKRVDS